MLCSFAILPALWACILSPADWHWRMPPIRRLILLNIVYMAMHDMWCKCDVIATDSRSAHNLDLQFTYLTRPCTLN